MTGTVAAEGAVVTRGGGGGGLGGDRGLGVHLGLGEGLGLGVGLEEVDCRLFRVHRGQHGTAHRTRHRGDDEVCEVRRPRGRGVAQPLLEFATEGVHEGRACSGLRLHVRSMNIARSIGADIGGVSRDPVACRPGRSGVSLCPGTARG
ncbi:hypothetical protein DEJ33_04450 [Curtobacterium sp. MCPF17_047]|nr:hypothetical protein DEJ33_04450 [Curtobacterium sp. MCPF17_047]